MTMSLQHADLAAGRWHTLSIHEQMGNIGSEVSRACRWQGKDPSRFDGAVRRALELFDLSLQDPRWMCRRREIARAREVFVSAVFGSSAYCTTLEQMQKYFDTFALAARRMR